MTVITESLQRTASFIISEAEHYRSRDTGTVVPGANTKLLAGVLLGKVTATGKLTAWDPTATNGTENVVGILYEEAAGVGASDEFERTLFARDGQVIDGRLVFPDGISAAQRQAGIDGLASLGIIVRKEA